MGEFPGRRWLMLGVVLAAAAGLLWRAVDLQWSHHEFLRLQGDARHLRVVPIPAHRGKLLDRNREPLAISTPVDSVWANPRELNGAPERFGELSALLGLDPERVARTLEERRDREFLYLRRHVEPGLAGRVEALGVPGVHLRREYRRYYPLGEVAGHVLGFTDVDDRGQEGLELAFEEWLRGEDGAKRVVRDRLGRIVEEVESIRVPRAGNDLVLSIDRRVQYLAYRALLGAVKRHRARGGTVVVLDAATGEILAMANQPGFNPNNVADRVGERYRNRAVTDVFEPGSTVKPFTVVSALENGLMHPQTVLDTEPGTLRVGRHTVRDVRNFGRIDVSTMIQKSSNVGAGKVALAVSPEELWRAFSRVGFGVSTSSGLPGESAGVLGHHLEWREIHRVTLSFGYGLSVTALQLAQAYAAIANGGLLAPLTVQPREGREESERVMSAGTAAALRDMLERAVQPEGTGSRARVPGFRVAGKTGTSRKAIPGGYAADRYLALFAGFAPASRPGLVAVVVIDEPEGELYYGGQVAAPVFAEVMTGALRIWGFGPDDREAVPRRIALGAPAPAVAADSDAAGQRLAAPAEPSAAVGPTAAQAASPAVRVVQ